MNIVLLDSLEGRVFLSREDPRTVHICDTLKMGVGGEFFVGVINGPKGKALIDKIDEKGIYLKIEWGRIEDEFLGIDMIVGMSRPQTVQKILQECTSLGVRRIIFFQSEKGEGDYSKSRLWGKGEWEKYVKLGAEQAFVTLVPEVQVVASLEEAVKLAQGSCFALDNYEWTESLGAGLKKSKAKHVTLAIGSERGWSKKERDSLRGHDFKLVHVGKRVLRVETAAIVGVGIVGGYFEGGV